MNIEKKLKDISLSYVSLPAECLQEFMSKSHIKAFKKGEIVVREGQYSKKAFLIFEGSARAYYLKNGKDVSDWFSFENQFMASILSFFSNKRSPHYVEFVEDSIVLQFSKETVDKLSNEYHDFERFIGKIKTETMLGLWERLHTIQFANASDRYERLLTIHPQITNRIPLTHIASYLGISLETLSRIRNPKNRI